MQVGRGAAVAFVVFALVTLAALVMLRLLWRSGHENR